MSVDQGLWHHGQIGFLKKVDGNIETATVLGAKAHADDKPISTDQHIGKRQMLMATW